MSGGVGRRCGGGALWWGCAVVGVRCGGGVLWWGVLILPILSVDMGVS